MEVPDEIDIQDVTEAIHPCPECGDVPLMAAMTTETPFNCQCGYEIAVHPFEDYIEAQRDALTGENDE